MLDIAILTDLRRELAAMTIPSVTQWNRVEGRPRTAAFDRALRAEVRDGLWMLARQWQMGEFRGDDAGAPVLAKMRMDHTRLTKTKLGEDPVEAMDDPLPLEATVERLRGLGSVRGGRKIAYDLRLLDGAAVAEADRRHRQPRARPSATHYPMRAPDPTSSGRRADRLRAPEHLGSSSRRRRARDGRRRALSAHLKARAPRPPTAWPVGGEAAAIDDAAEKFVCWFERLILQPPGKARRRLDSRSARVRLRMLRLDRR